MLNTKRMAGYLFALLAVLQMAAFFLYWQITAHLEIKWLVYLVYWIRNLAKATIPLFSAAAMLLLYTHGHKRLLLFPILPILSRALYYLPDHYLYYLEDQLTSAEALAMSALVTLLECALLYGFTYLLFLVAKTALRKSGAKKIDSSLEDAPIFSLEDSFIKSLFFVPFAYFCLQIAIETVRTISYLITNSGTYTVEEILTLILSYLMHFAILFLTHFFCVCYLRYAKKHYTVKTED